LQYLKDPWRLSKDESLEAALGSFEQVCHEVAQPTLKHLLLCSLWGNRSDLSLSSGNVDASVAQGGNAGKLLIDDSHMAEERINSIEVSGRTVIMVLDNCGAELLADLRLAEYLVNQKHCRVVLHVKPHPVFVSDATRADIHNHVDQVCRHHIRIGQTLRTLVDSGKIDIFEDFFYTSPLEFPFAPVRVKQQYETASLIIMKGDANYRRMLCDRHFPNDYPLRKLVAATTDSAMLAIRTCKSPIVVDLPKEIYDSVHAKDPNWCVNGTCGIIQFAFEAKERRTAVS
jgi:uncharacterized protein with ATP-grasp and redox domains